VSALGEILSTGCSPINRIGGAIEFMTKDPICGMTVDPESALSAERNNKTFYFCSEECQQKFIAAPAPRPAGPCAFVIFGASGDLTKRKLLPALYNLMVNGTLPEDFAIIGVARREWSQEFFRQQLREAMTSFATQKMDPALWEKLEEHIYYCQGSFDDAKTYEKLKTLLGDLDQKHRTGGNALFYLSVQPVSIATIARQLREVGLVTETATAWRRLIVEKPLGHDLASARELTAALLAALPEKQIYRIDHYLGKETAQNLLVFRLGNSMVEPIWNRRYIDRVEITMAETIGIEGRGAFYEKAGAFRDVMQNHMFMLLALVAMEPPTSLVGEAVRNEKAKLLENLRLLKPEEVLRDTVRGQYGLGKMEEKSVVGYREEPNVSPTSKVETFAAVKLWVDNWRWAGVPFYLRCGKRLPRHVTEIVIRFKSPPLSLFGGTECDPLGPNLLVMHIQPEEGITLQMRAKTPGPTIRTQAVALDFDYSQFGEVASTTGYEKLLYDCMVGDSTLFHRTDMVEAAWKVADPIVSAWENNPPNDFPNYMAGTWGPTEGGQLLQRDGHRWWTI
jgi:glucose-6-phosphate 1-dehydrogenase